MTTTLAAPPPPQVAPPPARGGAPARRAIRRWAWRLLRREWRQQVLVLALLTVAVAATTVGLGLVVNVQGTDQGVFGTADARLDIANPGPNGVAADVAAARQPVRHGRGDRPRGRAGARIDHPGRPARAGSARRRSAGRCCAWCPAATRPGPVQAAVTAAVATTFSLKIGSTWSVNGRPLRVVGIVENPKDLQDGFGLVAPGQISSPSSVTLLFDAERCAG